MKKLVRVISAFGIIAMIFILTVLTQVGGIALILSIMIGSRLNRNINRVWQRIGIQIGSFFVVYLLFVFAIVPAMAKPLGRVPLPLFELKGVRPANALTFLLNRNYVRPELKRIVFNTADFVNKKYPGSTLNYLDASFPFINKFPLFPHLSHNDGKKLDVSFFYKDSATNQETKEVPSWIGYGVCEEPMPGEVNRPEECGQKGFWQYSLLREYISQSEKRNFMFDAIRTKSLVNAFANEKNVGKILIEPHLKNRLKLTSSKIRLHGCNAVRHDDHIHVQLK